MPQVKKNSRYADTPLYQLRVGPALSNSFVYGVWERPFDWENYQCQTYHVVTRDEVGRLDLIAYKYYGDPTLWWVIADINNINNFLDDMQAGRELAIPSPADVRIGLSGTSGNSPQNNYPTY